VNEVRVWVIGLGTVGQWLLNALQLRAAILADRYGFIPKVVGVANARDGFVYSGSGLDPLTVLRLVSDRRSIAEHPGIRRWPSSVDGLRATEADVLVEVTTSADDGEPGITHMRDALRRRVPVVTSNQWRVALHGFELTELARELGVAFRAESTVMSGTPVLSSLLDGLAGSEPLALRGVLNATTNFILTGMERGQSYEDALAAAQDVGLTERDPTADVEGYDAVAKAMILAGLVFRKQLRREDVFRRGITEIDLAQLEAARSGGAHIKHVVTLESADDDGTDNMTARVEPLLLSGKDPLARVEGASNAVVCRSDPVGEVSIAGPGAGPELAGQGVLSDLIAVARTQ
jgi:homoserine dehydrogenase